MSEAPDPLVIKLSNVRLSYPVLDEKKTFRTGEGKPAWSATFLLDKKANAADIKKLQTVIAGVTKDEFAGKALPPDRVCLKDGSLKEDTDGYGDGVMFVAARNEKTRPGVVDRNLAQLTAGDPHFPYAGCYVNATIRLWAQGGKSFKSEFGKRINATLRNVQFLKDGEPFGEKPTPAEAEFEAVEDDSVV